MEKLRRRLHRSRTLSCFDNVRLDKTAVPRHAEGQVKLPPFRVLKRACSWTVIPLNDANMASSTSSPSLTSRKRPVETVSLTSYDPSFRLQIPDTSRSSIDPFIRGVTCSSLIYEAIIALILSVNIRELAGNGADAIVKALVKKTATLAAALLLAVLLDCAAPAMPRLGIDALLEVEIRGAIGIVSGWVGQQAGDPLGWKLEERIAQWLWPKPPPIANNAKSTKTILVDVDALSPANVVA